MIDRTRLYDTADALYRLAPWTWMHEAQLIGLRHPETRELAWMSMMGAGGTHCSLAVYLGEESLHRFNLMQHAGSGEMHLSNSDAASLILESRQVQISFAQRDELFKPERDEIKALGRKYRGGNWPCFRSFRPGRAPAMADASECRWLFHAMEQMAAVAPILRDDRFGDYRAGENGTEILTRECRDGQWHTVWTPADTRLFSFPSPAPNEFLAAKVTRNTPVGDIECQVQMLPNPVGPSRQESIFPYLLLSVESSSGMVLGTDMLSTEEQTYEEMIASIPDRFLKAWDAHSIRPGSLSVSSEATRALLKLTAKALGIPLKHRARLPALDRCLRSLSGFIGGGSGGPF